MIPRCAFVVLLVASTQCTPPLYFLRTSRWMLYAVIVYTGQIGSVAVEEGSRVGACLGGISFAAHIPSQTLASLGAKYHNHTASRKSLDRPSASARSVLIRAMPICRSNATRSGVIACNVSFTASIIVRLARPTSTGNATSM
jgi:hypothetical protein